jgi:hypothetical protein
MKRLVVAVLFICFSFYRPVVPIEQNGGSGSQEIPYKCSGFIDDVFSNFSAPGFDLLNPEMEAACSSRTSVSPYSTAQCTNAKGYNVKKSL